MLSHSFFTTSEISSVPCWQNAVAAAPLDKDFKQEKARLPIAVSKMKKLMQQDEIVRMIATETPILFSKAVEVFYADLVTQAWHIAQSCGRSTIVSADIKAACASCDYLEIFADLIHPTEPYVFDNDMAMMPTLQQFPNMVGVSPEQYAAMSQQYVSQLPQLPEEPFPQTLPQEHFPHPLPVPVPVPMPASTVLDSSLQRLLLPSSKPVEFSSLLSSTSSSLLPFDDVKSGPCEDIDFKSCPAEDSELQQASSSVSHLVDVDAKSLPADEEQKLDQPEAGSEFFLPSPTAEGMHSMQELDLTFSLESVSCEHVKHADAMFRPSSPRPSQHEAFAVPSLQRKRKRLHVPQSVSCHDTLRAQTFLSLQGPRQIVEP